MIAVIRYGAGNVRSVVSALRRLGADGVLTDDPGVVLGADKVIFPGVGEASSAMAALREKGLIEVIRSIERPFLGICLGMQLMCESSEEGDTECIGSIPVPVLRFPSGRGFKIPHMGWNQIGQTKGTLYGGGMDGSYMYFVHSYYVPLCSYTSAVAEYDGIEFSASLEKDNLMLTQFHPEKSGDEGEKVLRAFLEA